MTKKKSACDSLALALAGASAGITTLEGLLSDKPDDPRINLLVDRIKQYHEDANDHLVTVRFHLGLLV